MAYNIDTKSSVITYTSLNNIHSGVNYLNDDFIPVQSFHYTGSSSSGIHSTAYYIAYDPLSPVYTSTIKQDAMLIHVTGTITKYDLSDSAVMYYYIDAGPKVDHVSALPANLHGTLTTFDFQYINTRTVGTSHFVWFHIRPCDSSCNIVASPSKLDLTIDCYCI